MRNPEHQLQIIRIFEVTPDQLYAAWTNVETMRRWFGHLVEADPRVGGKYRVENPSGQGSNWAHVGEYMVLEPGRRIVMSFAFEGSEGSGFTNEYIDMRFRLLPGGRTEMTFVNGWDGTGMDDDERKALKEGWTNWFDQLAQALTGPDVVAIYKA